MAVAVVSLAAMPADGETVRADAARPVLRLVWFDPSQVAAGSELRARAETAALLARLGAVVSWRRGTSGEVVGNDGVRVILLGEGPPASGVPVLGATRKGHSAAPVVWIRVPNVRAAIGISRSRPPLALPPVELHLLGVALGRVIAHEIVHAVIPSVPHGTGLMSESLSYHQLTAASIPVDRELASALQAALRDDQVVAPSGAAVLAAKAGAQEQER